MDYSAMEEILLCPPAFIFFFIHRYFFLCHFPSLSNPSQAANIIKAGREGESFREKLNSWWGCVAYIEHYSSAHVLDIHVHVNRVWSME
ncbi:hypothetical protein I7I53_01533 [Histoplasma capsulatum var. duboisii H88]|uniref:Uncharacterized protein n=1 Tax=Ajellomyces capsulatus (strain H88) TaxID=544711 RepID=A0A8A1LKT1_AJEC8|nr:hypothetical protein I7I53_01533 [Histoplasma capsulatum var. duboisii H88]